MSEPLRTVHCADATKWLAEQPPFAGCSFITSLPDVSELPALSLEGWKHWFQEAAAQVIASCPEDGVAIFFQSDIKKEGAWIDKGYLVARAAEEVGATLLFHRIVCRRPAGTVTYGRAAYSHLHGFSRGVRLDLSKSLPDVLPEAGESNWTRGMGAAACRHACRFVRDHTHSTTIVDPYCGRGMVLAVANQLGFDAVGVELSAKRARKARNLVAPAS